MISTSRKQAQELILRSKSFKSPPLHLLHSSKQWHHHPFALPETELLKDRAQLNSTQRALTDAGENTSTFYTASQKSSRI